MKTRDDRQVRIFCTDGGGTFPVIGAVLSIQDMAGDDYWDMHRWNRDGTNRVAFSRDHDIHPDYLDEFKAAIAGGDGWRDIASAPKDGTPLLLRARANMATASCSVIGWYLEGQDAWVEVCFSGNIPIGINPTHWRPLPAPPEAP